MFTFFILHVISTNEPSLLLHHLSNSLFRRTNLHHCFIIFLNSLFRRTNLRYCFINFRTRYFAERTFATALSSFELIVSTNEPSLLLYHLSNLWMYGVKQILRRAENQIWTPQRVQSDETKMVRLC